MEMVKCDVCRLNLERVGHKENRKWLLDFGLDFWLEIMANIQAFAITQLQRILGRRMMQPYISHNRNFMW